MGRGDSAQLERQRYSPLYGSHPRRPPAVPGAKNDDRFSFLPAPPRRTVNISGRCFPSAQGLSGGSYLHKKLADGVWLRCYLSGWNDGVSEPGMSASCLVLEDPGRADELQSWQDRCERHDHFRFKASDEWYEDPQRVPPADERDPRNMIGEPVQQKYGAGVYPEEPQQLIEHYRRTYLGRDETLARYPVEKVALIEVRGSGHPVLRAPTIYACSCGHFQFFHWEKFRYGTVPDCAHCGASVKTFLADD